MYYSKSRNIPPFFPHPGKSNENEYFCLMIFPAVWRDFLYSYHKRTFPRSFISKEVICAMIAKDKDKKMSNWEREDFKAANFIDDSFEFFDTNINFAKNLKKVSELSDVWE